MKLKDGFDFGFPEISLSKAVRCIVLATWTRGWGMAYQGLCWKRELLLLCPTTVIKKQKVIPELSLVQSLSRARLFVTPWTAAHQASLSITNSGSLLKLMSFKLVILSNHLILCHPLLLLPSIFPSIRGFLMSQLFVSAGQSIGTSASVSVLPMNIQDWFPLGWTVLILQSKGSSRVFSNTTVQKHQFLGAQLSLGSTLTSIHDYWKNRRLD